MKYSSVFLFPKLIHFFSGAPNNFDVLPTYSTLRFSYTEEEFYKFNSLVRHNVRKNIDKIIKCITQNHYPTCLKKKHRKYYQMHYQKSFCKGKKGYGIRPNNVKQLKTIF